MKKWEHINFEQRKIISSGISHNKLLKEIAYDLNLDPTSISKEVKRNRVVTVDAINSCQKLNRWPYVCNNCSKKYGCVGYKKYKYDAKKANELAQQRLIESRKGIDLTSDEFCALDEIVKDGVNNNKSIYQIVIENKDIINKSVTTIYRYINNSYLTTKKYDLPFAVKYKKRKHIKKYDYSNNFIDRTGHTYIDYLAYIKKHPNSNVWQLDFLGAIKSDSKAIITFILPNLHFTKIDIISNPNSSKVVDFFDELEIRLGTQTFVDLFGVILTDRDPCFSDINGICFSKITGEERCKLFFCDPYVSNQKPNVENMNRTLRKFYPKGKSIENLTKKDIKEDNITILNTPIKSLDGFTPKEAFIKVYDEELFNKIIL